MLKFQRVVFWTAPVLAVSIFLFCGCGKGGKDAADKKGNAGVKRFMPEHTLDFDGLKITFVQLDSTNLWVGKFKISNEQYKKVFPDHFSGYHEGIELDGPSQPVVNVSWRDAQKFCAYLNKTLPYDANNRYTFRLPTETEWTHFATCGKKTRFPWGDNWPPPGDWNYFGEENPGFGMKVQGHNDRYLVSSSVSKCGYNKWGIYGAGSNVKEWCQNAYDETKKFMTFKGASWSDSHPDFLAVEKRNYYESDYKYVNLGFRVVAEVEAFSQEEKEEMAEKLRLEKEKAEAARLKKEQELKEQAEKAKEMAEKERREKRMLDQNEIQRLVNRREYENALAKLDEYSVNIGKDDFYKEWHHIVSNIKIIALSDDVAMEFVRFDQDDIWVGRFEVTNREFRKFKPGHDSGSFRQHSLAGDDQPVVNVSWHEAKAFCDWLNNEYKDQIPSTYKFRLPSEKEWEQIASCNEDDIAFPWGNDWPPQAGNYGIMPDYDDGFPVTCPVMESGKNKLGIYGMGGNVWEWVEDWYDTTQTSKIFKGGAWNQSTATALRITNRNADSPDKQTPYVGFRVVIGKF